MAVEWTPSMLAKLGTMPDQAIADSLGVSLDTVARKRLQKGIRSFTGRVASTATQWSKEMLECLGKMADTDVSRRFRINIHCVEDKRHSLGIEPKRKWRPPFRWDWVMLREVRTLPPREFAKKYGVSIGVVHTKRRLLDLPLMRRTGRKPAVPITDGLRSLLGKLPDKVLARQYHVPKSTIQVVRARLGIPACPNPQRHAWTEEETRLVGAMSDHALARRLGVSVNTVRKKRVAMRIEPHGAVPVHVRWTKKSMALLGTVPDATLARKLGIEYDSVRYMREKLGLPRYGQKHIRWTEEMIARLGRCPEYDLAKEWGIGRYDVRKKRIEMGVPAYVRQRSRRPS